TVNKLPKWQDTVGALVDSNVFESGGNVGIGTTTPIGKLKVSHECSASYITLSAYGANAFDKGVLRRAARAPSGAPRETGHGHILSNVDAEGHNGADYAIGGGRTMAVDGAVIGGVVPGAIMFQTTNAAGTFAERMRVTAAGNLGIGTAAPTEKLEVTGNLKVN